MKNRTGEPLTPANITYMDTSSIKRAVSSALDTPVTRSLPAAQLRSLAEFLLIVYDYAIIANRYDACLDDVREKVYTRHIFRKD